MLPSGLLQKHPNTGRSQANCLCQSFGRLLNVRRHWDKKACSLEGSIPSYGSGSCILMCSRRGSVGMYGACSGAWAWTLACNCTVISCTSCATASWRFRFGAGAGVGAEDLAW
jgi:hypothetical protein